MFRSRSPLRQFGAVVAIGLLAACGDSSTTPHPSPTPSPTPTPPVVRARLSHRGDATLDSLFGADAAALDSALAVHGSALDARGAAWVDSVAAAFALDALDARPDARSARTPASIRSAPLDAEASADRTFSAQAVVPTSGGLRSVRLDYSYQLTVSAARIQLDVVDTDRVHDGAAVGTPLEQDFASYTRIMSRTMTVVPCPDASGRSVGTWEGDIASYGARASGAMADPDRWTFKTVERAAAMPVHVNVGADAFRASVDVVLAYDVERWQGSTYMTGGVEVRRAGVSIPNLILPLGGSALSNVSGDYTLIADKLGAGDVGALHFWMADDIDKTSAAAQRVWRGGSCVEVQEPGGPVQPASPGARMTLRPIVVHRQDGTRPVAPVEAHAEGGAVSPDGVPVSSPAVFAYTASPTGAGRVDFRTVSSRGIGTGAVLFTALEAGAGFEFQSTTEYVIDSRDPLGEVTTGSMRGTQQLTSRLSLAPDEPDEGDRRAFTIVARTDVRADAGGSTRTRGPAYADYDGETSFSLAAAGTSADPSPHNAAHDQVHPEQFVIDPDVAGRLALFRHAGRDYYAFDLGLSGVVATFKATGRMREVCDRTVPPSTAQLEYDNGAHRYTSVVSDAGSCWPHASDTTARANPFAFGAIGLDRRSADPVTGRSEMFIGTYDARTGLIEGSESVTVRGCREVAERDPLQLGTVLNQAPSWKSPVELEQGTCTFTYTVKWRFFVPPQ